MQREIYGDLYVKIACKVRKWTVFVEKHQNTSKKFSVMPKKKFGSCFAQIPTAIRLSRDIFVNQGGYVNNTGAVSIEIPMITRTPRIF